MTAASPDLVQELRRRGVSDVDDSTLARALYSSDASLYRVVPRVVVRPRYDRRDHRRPRRVAHPRRARHDARRRHVDRRQRRGPRHRRRHGQAPGQRAVDRPRGADRGRAAGHRAREPAAGRGAVRAPLRARPLDAPALHHRRDDRQQRLRLAGARLRPDGRQRRGPHGRLRHRRGLGRQRDDDRDGPPDRDGRAPPRPHQDELRPVHPAGQRLLAGAPAPRAASAGPLLRGLRGDARRRPGGDRAAGRDAGHAAARAAGLPVDGGGRRRRPRAALRRCRAAHRVRGPRRPDRRPGQGQGVGRARAAARVPGGCSSRWRARTRSRWRRRSSLPSSALGHRTVDSVSSRRPSGGSARTAPAWPPAA